MEMGSRGVGLNRVCLGVLYLELAFLHASLPMAYSASPVYGRGQQPAELGMGRRRELAPAVLHKFRHGAARPGVHRYDGRGRMCAGSGLRRRDIPGRPGPGVSR